MQPINSLINLYDGIKQHLPPIGWIEVNIHYIIDITIDGRLIAISDTNKTYFVPGCDTGRTRGIVPYTLWDKRDYIFGDGAGNNHQKAARDYYLTLPQHIVSPVIAWLDSDPLAQLQAYDAAHPLLDPKNTKTNCAYRISPDVEILINRPDMVDYINALPTDEVYNHIKFSGVPGGNASGASLVSYNNQSSSRHYNLVDNAMDGISYNDMLKYTGVMQYLLDNQKIKISENLALLYATDTDTEDINFLDAMFGYTSPTDDKNKIDSIMRGVYSGKYCENQGNLITWTIRGGNGRIAMVDHKKITIAEFQANIKKWFDVMGDTKIWPILKLITHPHTKKDLIASIIFGEPVPAYIICAINAKLLSPNTERRNRTLLTNLLMYCIGDIMDSNYGVIVGKLLMVYEAMQNAASEGNINVNITDKYLRRIATNPESTLVSIANLATHWRAKLRRTGKNVRYDKMISELMNELANADKSTMNQLDVHIGYHLQSKKIYAKSAPVDTAPAAE